MLKINLCNMHSETDKIFDRFLQSQLRYMSHM